ncbi:hypothetical protein [Sphaerisporangium sp. TRM90804]|uniref:hypothetical protein n=1 Tax=Sphaerisporangium sp. TRM90804 TaxID=3031113 RepID=UPI00244BDFC8|nr:hypothetical protein [Sphaerisporangium sp. TRM90804]MDH2427482.1 hypothetical protein [Sphaerisporangium sp. TRM90804]
MTVRRLALVAGVLPVLVLAGCGAAEAPQVASASGAKGSAAASPSASPAVSSDPLKFAQCMREHGIDMKDPEQGGRISIKIKKGDEGKLDTAQKACGKYMQGGGDGPGRDDPAVRDAMLKFAACMRAEGLDVPDPEPGKGGIRIRRDDSVSEEVFERAHKKCEHFMPGAATGKGGPAGETRSGG